MCCNISEKCLVSADPALYTFINQGVLTVDGMSDVDEMKLTDVSYIYIRGSRERWVGVGVGVGERGGTN